MRMTRKNPMMSLWLSGANSVMGKATGAARGLMTAAARQQQRAMTREAEKMAAALWPRPRKEAAPKKRRK